MAHVRLRVSILQRWGRRVLSQENLYALILCCIILAALIATADASPQWIYQGF